MRQISSCTPSLDVSGSAESQQACPAGLYLAIGKTFLPNGNVWAIIVVWFCATIGGYLATLVRTPPSPTKTPDTRHTAWLCTGQL